MKSDSCKQNAPGVVRAQLDLPASGPDNVAMTDAVQSIPVVGLVGGVGSGKSFVAAECQRQGCAVVDADAIGHAVLQSCGVRADLVAAFGEGIVIDGAIDRSALGHIVFSSAEALGQLNAIMHPVMGAEMARQIADYRQAGDVCAIVLDAAVLFEAGWDRQCDAVIFVEAPRAQRVARVAGRGWDEAELDRREKAQIALDKKRALCDHVLVNHASDSRLSKPVKQLLSRIILPGDVMK